MDQQPPPTCECDCDCGCSENSGVSVFPVRFFNGEVILEEHDVDVASSPLGQSRSYNNRLTNNYKGPLGNNWLVPDWPYLVQETSGSDSVLVYVRGQSNVWFDKSGSTFTARYGGDNRYTLTQSGSVFTLTVQADDGLETLEFHDFSATNKGLLKSRVDAYDQTTTAHSYQGEAISELRCTLGGTLWSMLYEFYPAGANTDRVKTATLRSSTDSGSNWSLIRRASYEYYTGSEPSNEAFGMTNDLKLVTIETRDGGNWADASKQYYRWYKTGESNGFVGGVKYVVGPQAYAEMLADSLTPKSATNAEVASYADYYFEYDSNQKVTKEVAQGGGGGTGDDGETMTRTESSHSNNYNHWRWKVVVTKANDNVETVYTNYLGQVMLKELKESSVSSRKWLHYTKYGDSGGAVGKQIEMAGPEAVVSFDENEADLDVTLESSQGAITYNTYGSSTTADGDTLGDVTGYLKRVEISEGSSGTKIKQQQLQYKTSTDTAKSVYVVGKVTQYRNDDGTGAIDTSYGYQWYTTPKVSVKERTTTLPAISSGQHGDGTSATTKQFFDADGNLTFSQDARGIVTKNTYDSATDQLTKTQVDVDSSESGLPSGWTVGGSTPHQNLTSDFEYDDQGRMLQSLGPEHEVDLSGTASDVRRAQWFVYKEAVSGDQTWVASGYRRSSDASNGLVDPVDITMFDKVGRPTDQIQSSRSTGTGKLSASDTFLRADWTRWSVNFYNTVGLPVTSRAYHTIPAQSPDEGLGGVASDSGSEHTNYEETHFGYDVNTNQQTRQVTPDGTITRTVYDKINRVEQTWTGTDDIPTAGTWQDWSPTNTGGTNLVKLSQNTYDNGSAGGPSHLTKVEHWVDGNTTRATSYQYDFRGRQTLVSGEESQCSQYVYDNLNQLTETTQHDGCPGSPPVPGTLIGKQQTSFDDRGRVYESKNYAVNPSTGVAGNALVSDVWYDEAENITKQIDAGDGEMFSRREYDNLGRLTLSLTGYEDDSAPDDEVVIEQSELAYDEAGNLLSTTTKQRDTDTPIASPTFRASYAANWFDGIDRQIASADYGTNGGSAWTRPTTVPTRSDDILVTSMLFNDAGELYSTTDPADTEARTEFDAMGRRTKQIENYQSSGSGTDINVTTEFTYTADSQIETLTAKMTSSADDQVTTYVYGVTVAGGSDLTVNNLLLATQYPEDTSSKREEYQYNRQGERIEKKDQNGTVHGYNYDGLGRQTQDRITTFGSGIDQSVKRIATSFDVRGLVNSVSSHDHATVGSGNVVNEVELQYNDFRQLTTQYIAGDGTVNTSTSPKIEYGYASGASGSNQIRATSVTYPGSRVIDFGYGASGGVNDKLNRVFAVEDGSTNLAEYKYLGSSDIVEVDYTQPSLKMDLWGGTAGSYSGLDRFARTIDLPWIQHSGSPTDRARIKYGYNRASSPLYARDEVARTNSADLDQLYAYDGLQRLVDFQQGELNSGNTSVSNKTLTQDWGLDQVGNWDDFDQGITGVLNQTRTHNKVNEITGISESGGQPQWVTPAYDDAGNSTELPRPTDLTEKYELTYDAWNRIVSVESTNGQTTLVAKYQYDGQNHRLIKQKYDGSGNLASTVDYFYNAQWQCLEEQETPVGGSTVTTEYVWGMQYIDDLIARDIGSNRLYAMQGKQFKMIALSDTSGSVVERYSYTPYGEVVIYDASFNVRSSSSYDWIYLYTGRRLDEETGLYYFRNRYYHAQLGRFCSRDPIGFEGSSWNSSDYERSSPISYRNPFGKWWGGGNDIGRQVYIARMPYFCTGLKYDMRWRLLCGVVRPATIYCFGICTCSGVVETIGGPGEYDEAELIAIEVLMARHIRVACKKSCKLSLKQVRDIGDILEDEMERDPLNDFDEIGCSCI